MNSRKKKRKTEKKRCGVGVCTWAAVSLKDQQKKRGKKLKRPLVKGETDKKYQQMKKTVI